MGRQLICTWFELKNHPAETVQREWLKFQRIFFGYVSIVTYFYRKC